ncbi:MAG: Rrf2 family transcriptional regulator [Zymomonas mobilis]|uniref:RrF2 family transcriptional regulator n=1 Tax=Zymomonas mobilis TaxID=542 RepID=UPI0001B707CE|nr:Rrf2 family transcriptional regulator [Zymomonas mobilis]ACV75628.1 transcriptional regulator, BadM/Rrf2 family [Zymomonas mobilis subsp. mobilis NCIMB 11163]
MLSISQSTGYAVLALSAIHAESEKLTMARDIAEKANIPRPYLTKILGRLQEAGLITAKRGQNGGLRLNRPPETISLLEIVKAIDGKDWGCGCFLGLPGCSNEHPCQMHSFWLKTRPVIVKQLENMTLDKAKHFTEAGWKFRSEEG